MHLKKLFSKEAPKICFSPPKGARNSHPLPSRFSCNDRGSWLSKSDFKTPDSGSFQNFPGF